MTATYVDRNAYHILTVPLRDGVFYQNTQVLSDGEVYENMQVGDLNSDGLDDIVLTGLESLEAALQNSSGNFELMSPVFQGETDGRFVLTDLNVDTSLDICCRNGSSLLVLAFNDGNGHFANKTVFEIDTGRIQNVFAFHPANLTMTMLGVTTVGGPGERALSVFSNDGHGNLHLETTASLTAWPVDVGAGDFNGDGSDEIAVMDNHGNLSMVAWNGSSFHATSINVTGLVGTFGFGWMLPVRLNGDLYCDLVFVTDGDTTWPGSIGFFLSTGSAFSETACVWSFRQSFLGAQCADLDDDGDSDILLTELDGTTLALDNDMSGAPARYMVLPITVLPHAPVSLRLAGNNRPSVAVLSERSYGWNWMQIAVFSREGGVLSEAVPFASQYLYNLPLLIGQWTTVFVWVSLIVMVLRGRMRNG